jgi:hypothetical protein
MFKLVTLLVLTTMLSSAYGLYQFNLTTLQTETLKKKARNYN